jgi:hypothetical protein
MSQVSAPYGLIPTYHPSGIIRPAFYGRGIVSGLAANLFKYAPVLLQTDGTLTVAGATGAFLGSFAGCSFTDAFGRRQHSPAWISGTVGTNIEAWVWDDQETRFRIQATGPLPLSARGDEANLVGPGTGNATTLYSTAQISTVLAGAGVQAQLRIIDKYETVFNDWSDSDPVAGAFTDLIVKIAQSQLAAPFVAV